MHYYYYYYYYYYHHYYYYPRIFQHSPVLLPSRVRLAQPKCSDCVCQSPPQYKRAQRVIVGGFAKCVNGPHTVA